MFCLCITFNLILYYFIYFILLHLFFYFNLIFDYFVHFLHNIMYFLFYILFCLFFIHDLLNFLFSLFNFECYFKFFCLFFSILVTSVNNILPLFLIGIWKRYKCVTTCKFKFSQLIVTVACNSSCLRVLYSQGLLYLIS